MKRSYIVILYIHFVWFTRVYAITNLVQTTILKFSNPYFLFVKLVDFQLSNRKLFKLVQFSSNQHIKNRFKMVLNSTFKIPTPLELLKSIPNAKQNWKLKTPMQKWCYLYSIGKIPYDFVRVFIFKENVHHVHWFNYFLQVYLSVLILLSFYTIYYYQMRGELQASLTATCMANLALAVCI